MPIKTCCEVLFGYMLIIKIIDYVLINYSFIAFVAGQSVEVKRHPNKPAGSGPEASHQPAQFGSQPRQCMARGVGLQGARRGLC